MEACFLPSTGKKQLPAQDKVSLGTQFRKLRLGTRQDMLEIWARNDSKMPRVKRWDSTRTAQALALGTGGKRRRFVSCSPSPQLRSSAGEWDEGSDGEGEVGSGKHANGTRTFPCLANWVRAEPPPCVDWQAASPRVLAACRSVSELSRGRRSSTGFGTLGLIAGGWRVRCLCLLGCLGPW